MTAQGVLTRVPAVAVLVAKCPLCRRIVRATRDGGDRCEHVVGVDAKVSEVLFSKTGD